MVKVSRRTFQRRKVKVLLKLSELGNRKKVFLNRNLSQNINLNHCLRLKIRSKTLFSKSSNLQVNENLINKYRCINNKNNSNNNSNKGVLPRLLYPSLRNYPN